MSKYDNIKDLKDEEFRLLTAVKRNTFNLMLKYLIEENNKKKQTGKHKIKLIIEDKLA